jgi:outer membrane autotransporter protein
LHRGSVSSAGLPGLARALTGAPSHRGNAALRVALAASFVAVATSAATAAPIIGTNGSDGGSVASVATAGAGGDGATNPGSGGLPSVDVGGFGATGINGNGAGGGAGGLNYSYPPLVYPLGGVGGSSDFGTGGGSGSSTAAAGGGGEEAGGGGGYGGLASNSAGAGGGGGGGRGETITTNAATILATDPVTGGKGGNGGSGLGPYGDGGGGGGGGIGVVFTGTTSLVVNGTITGGAGGNGGNGSLNTGDDTYGASGGAGGTGLRVTQSGVTVTVNAAITGGQGGAIGLGLHTPIKAVTGAGGAGIVGAGITIIDNASISGGLSGDSTKRGNAITVTGGSNYLTLNSGWGLTGNIGVANAGTTLTFRQTTMDATVSNIITGAGGVIVDDDGSGYSLTLAGTSTYTGQTTVSSGKLIVNGSIATSSSVVVQNGGILGGTGIVSALKVSSGGILAPGNSIGTTYAASASFDAGSIYDVEVNGGGNSDVLSVTGTTTITGGKVVVLPFPDYAVNTPYTIITSGGAVSGQFDEVDFTGSLFQKGVLTYDTNNVYLTIVQGSFASLALTPNQAAAATGAESLGAGNSVYDAIFALGSADEARQAYDALSGEIHASTAGVLIDDSRYLRDAVFARLHQANGGDGPAMWVQAYGAHVSAGGDGNAASLVRDLGGVVAGADATIADGWRAGIATGFARTAIGVADRSSSATVGSYHLAGYLGGTLGQFAVRTGGAWTWNDIDTARTIAFPGFMNQASASYHGKVGQLFGELALPFASAGQSWEPFARAAYVNMDSDAFTETGGAAALTSDGMRAALGYTMLGARATGSMQLAGMAITPYASLAWQHAIGNVDPSATLMFASGGSAFTVLGTPLARDSVLVDAGIGLAIAPETTLGIAYSGRFANNLTDNAVNGRLDWHF